MTSAEIERCYRYTARNMSHTSESEVSQDIILVPDEDVKDPHSDPENPVQVTFQDVSAAAYKIKGAVVRTPCTKSQLSELLEMELYFKKDFLQFTGSFKERGVRFSLLSLSEDQRKKGVIAASAGNHALALAYHGNNLGIPVTVVMPFLTPLMRVSNCRHYGAKVIVLGRSLKESTNYALYMAQDQGLLYISGYDYPKIIAGHGTMGLEIIEQVPDLDACIIPVGGGGLIAGTALAIKSLYPKVKIIGVEIEKCTSFSSALGAGKPVITAASSSIADGLIIPTVGVNAFATARCLIDRLVAVQEESIALAILRLIELEKAVVEGAGAVGLAAIMQGLLPELTGKKVVVALCGGNIDTTALGRVIERGLAADGRLVRFTVTISDQPGGIAELTKIISEQGVSIKDLFHERAWLKSDIFSVQVKCIAETRDLAHSKELEEILRNHYKKIRWGPTYC